MRFYRQNPDPEENRRDYGREPMVVNMWRATEANPFYRRTLWTGKYMQVTLMTIPVGGDIGLEVHPDTDQFIRLESGHGLVQLGSSANHMNESYEVNGNFAVIVPAGTYHNITNIGRQPLRIYTIYAPPHHPFGTVHETKESH